MIHKLKIKSPLSLFMAVSLRL